MTGRECRAARRGINVCWGTRVCRELRHAHKTKPITFRRRDLRNLCTDLRLLFLFSSHQASSSSSWRTSRFTLRTVSKSSPRPPPPTSTSRSSYWGHVDTQACRKQQKRHVEERGGLGGYHVRELPPSTAVKSHPTLQQTTLPGREGEAEHLDRPPQNKRHEPTDRHPAVTIRAHKRNNQTTNETHYQRRRLNLLQERHLHRTGTQKKKTNHPRPQNKHRAQQTLVENSKTITGVC